MRFIELTRVKTDDVFEDFVSDKILINEESIVSIDRAKVYIKKLKSFEECPEATTIQMSNGKYVYAKETVSEVLSLISSHSVAGVLSSKDD